MTREWKRGRRENSYYIRSILLLLWSFLLALTIHPLNKTYSSRHFFFSRNNSGISPCVIQILGSKC